MEAVLRAMRRGRGTFSLPADYFDRPVVDAVIPMKGPTTHKAGALMLQCGTETTAADGAAMEKLPSRICVDRGGLEKNLTLLLVVTHKGLHIIGA